MQDLRVFYPSQSLSHIGFPLFAEKPARLVQLEQLWKRLGIKTEQPPQANLAVVQRAHSTRYIEHIESMSKMSPARATLTNFSSPYVQWYTRVSSGSYEAALYAAGAVTRAVEDVLIGDYWRAFCAVRPPGHHAGPSKGEGFCLFNNVAIGALHAMSFADARVAIVDFDRHHGNGTQDIVENANDSRLLFISSFQEDCKYSKHQKEGGGSKSTIVHAPIPHRSDYRQVSAEYAKKVLPALYAFKPDLILLSAGFDMHKSDPLTNIRLESKDYYELTNLLTRAANDLCSGRIVSVLEGGYNLPALESCVEAHVKALGSRYIKSL